MSVLIVLTLKIVYFKTAFVQVHVIFKNKTVQCTHSGLITKALLPENMLNVDTKNVTNVK